MNASEKMQGDVSITVVSADAAALIRQINTAGIVVYRFRFVDDLTVMFEIKRNEKIRTMKVIEENNGQITDCRELGFVHHIKGVIRRPVLIAGAILICVLSCWLPTRILFTQVDGNTIVPTSKILAAAEHNGLCFGASRKAIRSEKVKNALLSAIPQLEWIGVNTSGCVAKISVRERQITVQKSTTPIVASIMASHSGVIRQMTVVRGRPVCRVGQAVKAGELLVSGYHEGGVCIYATQAEAEIYADTQRQLCTLTPNKCRLSMELSKGTKKYALCFGKKRINFYKGSGICDTTCDKMYSRYNLILPGGWELPIGICVEEIKERTVSVGNIPEPKAALLLEHFSQRYLRSQMIAGEITGSAIDLVCDNDVYYLDGRYHCTEMIGQTRFEETLD